MNEANPSLAGGGPTQAEEAIRLPTINDYDIKSAVQLMERLRNAYVKEVRSAHRPLLTAALGIMLQTAADVIQSSGFALKLSAGGITWARKDLNGNQGSRGVNNTAERANAEGAGAGQGPGAGGATLPVLPAPVD